MKLFWLLLLTALLSGCADSADDAETDGPDGGTESSSGDMPIQNETAEGNAVALSIAAVRALPTDTHSFDKVRLEVNQGDIVTLTLSNTDILPVVNHDWYLEVLDVGTAQIASGQTDSITFTADLGPGEYVFYCTVGSHRADGMEGVLVVL